MFPVIFASQRRRAAAWTPGDLPGTPREWLAGPDWCYTDGSAAFASASSQYLSVASNSTLQTGDVDFWWAGWVYFTDTANGTLGAQDSDTLGRSWNLDRVGADVRFFINGGGGADLVTAPTPATSTWAFVLAWRDKVDATINVRINGGSVASSSTASAPAVATGPWRLGANAYVGSENYLNGRLASVAFGKSPPGGIASIISTISSRLYASGNGIVYADTTAQERTDWGLVSWWDLVRSGVFTDSHGSNNLTNNNGVTFGAGLPRSRAGDTDPISAWVDRFQGTTVSQSDPLKRPTLRLVGGKWVVRGDGVNDWMQALAASLTLPQPYTAWAALTKTSDNTANGVILDSEALVQAAWYFGDTPPTAIKLAGGGGMVVTTAEGTSPTVTVAVANGASSRVRANQVEWTGSIGTNSLTGLRVFDIRAGVLANYVLAADLAGFGLLDSAISVGNQSQLEAYLNTLYPSY